jgi:hypothetical protein
VSGVCGATQRYGPVSEGGTGRNDRQDDAPKDGGGEGEIKVLSLKEELDIYDNLTKPVADALDAAEAWKQENPGT